jgi:hypothetical protein
MGECNASTDILQFLRELDDYVSYYGGTPRQQLNLVISCLKSEAKTFARAFHIISTITLLNLKRFSKRSIGLSRNKGS